MTIAKTVAKGVAKPISKRLTPSILLIKYDTGILTRKVDAIPCKATKSVLPQPLKNPVIEKTNPTITQSME